MGPWSDDQGAGKGASSKAKEARRQSSADKVFIENEAMKKVAKPPRRDPDAAIAKCIADNFKGWSQHDIHGTPDPETGMNLWETLVDSKRKHKEEPKVYPMGSKFYRHIKQKFMPESFPAKQLKAKDPDEVIEDELLKAMMYYKSTNSRAKMDSFIQHSASLNQRECVGIYTYFLELKPSTSSDQLKCALNVMRMVKRLGLLEKYPTETELIKQHMYPVLSQAHLTMKSSAVTPAQFVSMHGEILSLILPMSDLKKVLRVSDGVFKPVKGELASVVNSSNIGRRLLGFLCKQTLAEETATIIETGIKDFLNSKGKKTIDAWSMFRKDIVDKVSKEPLVCSWACPLLVSLFLFSFLGTQTYTVKF